MNRMLACLALCLLLPELALAMTAGSAGARLFAAPDADAAYLGTLLPGAPVEVRQTEGDYIAVQLAGLTAYAPSEQLSDASAEVALREVIVASPYGTPTVVLRSLPGNAYGTVAVLASGQRVRLLGEMSGGYVIVQGGGTIGFLSRDEIE